MKTTTQAELQEKYNRAKASYNASAMLDILQEAANAKIALST